MRIYGSLPAEKCIDKSNNVLCVHNLTLSEDIISLATNGTSMMKKVGKILNIF